MQSMGAGMSPCRISRVDFPATTGGASAGVLPLPGGGLNSTLTVPLPEGLPSGSSIDVAFTFQVDAGGPFWFGYDVDAMEAPDCSGQGLRTARVRLKLLNQPARPRTAATLCGHDGNHRR